MMECGGKHAISVIFDAVIICGRLTYPPCVYQHEPNVGKLHCTTARIV